MDSIFEPLCLFTTYLPGLVSPPVSGILGTPKDDTTLCSAVTRRNRSMRPQMDRPEEFIICSIMLLLGLSSGGLSTR